MPPKIVFHPDVYTEIKSSYVWYQKQACGLGEDFLNELESAYDKISNFSKTWPIFQDDFRRFLLPKFPFSIIYKEHKDKIFIVAVMHNNRRPHYWNKRNSIILN